MDKNFLLTTDTAVRLYNECAKNLPIIDFHNHLSVEDIVNDRQFSDIAQMWLISDPYKHRAMRICGIEEKYITGESTNYEKFVKWCSIVPSLWGNPLYHWSHMEMSDVFGIDLPINEENAPIIWDKANEKLKENGMSAKGLLKKFGVEYGAPCAMITDDVSVFDGIDNMSPSMRCDGMLPLTAEFINRLSESSNIHITTAKELFSALSLRIKTFHEAGCRFADHALDDGFSYIANDGENDARIEKIIRGESLSDEDNVKVNSYILNFMGREYAKYNWVMQLHMGAQRYTSSRLRALVGPAGGFAGIGECNIAAVTRLLDDMEKENALPRTILFTLNPAYNAQLSILSGSYSEDGVRGKVQQGAAWWWCDHLGGIRGVLETISEFSALSVFMGMTTDSRSLLSFIRHDYFRRVLCSWIGEKAESGIWEADEDVLFNIVANICYYNIKNVLN